MYNTFALLEHTSIVVICNFCQQLQMQYDNGMIEYSDSSNTKQNPQFFFIFSLYKRTCLPKGGTNSICPPTGVTTF